MILYTTHCPKCNILKMKLQDKDIMFTEVTDIEVMESKGIRSVPVLEDDNGIMMDFMSAVKFVSAFQSP